MKKIASILLCLGVCHVAALASDAGNMQTFFLEGVRSGRLYGPFPFQTGAQIQLETGNFQLDVLSDAGSFILTELRTGAVFGVYELVPGRIIDAGYQLFTITRITTKPLPTDGRMRQPQQDHEQRPAFYESDYRLTIVADIIHRIAYDWDLDGENVGSAQYLERRGATLALSRGILTLQAGVILDAEWNETVAEPTGRFEEGTLANGTGWKAGISLLVPVFNDGRWSASLGGGLSYQRETFDLEFGQWQTVDFDDNTTTNGIDNGVVNGVTNGVPDDVSLVAGERFVRQSQSATLTETVLNLNARLDYTAPNWFIFGGLHVEPWSDTDLQATVEIADDRFPLSFSRRHPFSGYAGAGFTYHDVQSYVEVEAGGVNAIRLGVALAF